MVMATREPFSVKKYALWIVCALFAVLLSIPVYAGIPEKYGTKTVTKDGRECSRVKFYIYSKSVIDNGYRIPNPTCVDYFPDGSVEWVWREEDYRDNIGAKGTRIDDAGSFSIKAGTVVDRDYYSGTVEHLSSNTSLYPMMQYDGDDILLINWDDLIFRASSDEIIRFDNNKADLPSEAKIGFGPIDTDYSTWRNNGQGEIIGIDTSEFYKYGPNWQMFLDFSMSPDSKYLDSIDDIINDSKATDTPIFDIYGRPVKRTDINPGIYIYKGRRVLVK